MKTLTLITIVTLGLLAAVATTAFGGQGQGKLQKVQDPAPALTPVPPPVPAGPDWAEAMGAADLDRRLELYDALLERARRDPELQGQIEQAARGGGELGWTSRLALRELARPRSPFDALRGWHRDPFGSPLGGADPWGGGGLFPGFDRDLQDLLRRAPQLQAPGTGLHSQGLQIQTGPDGVRVEVREETGEGAEVKTYEAESLEELLEQFPELRERIGTDPLAPGDVFPGPSAESFDRLLEQLLGGGGPPTDPAPFGGGSGLGMPTDRLGVMVRSPAAQDPTSPAPLGLYVERVLPGTLAEALGVEVGDTLLRLNGRELRGVEDVRAALQARGSDEALRLERLDRSGQRGELSWQPAQSLSLKRDTRI